ncbi:MAG: response regulator [Candidatus Omnitrophota bacterium]|nr:MAG: response regulator [Candidatus Omnitrophota bacterium]
MAKSKILVIDDEKEFLHLIKEKLELEGYEVITASDGEEGLISAQVCEPDLVICDIKMPKKDGFEVLKELKQHANFRAPFIMLTVVDDFDKIKEAYEYAADFYITKPVELYKLSKNIKILLNLSKSKKNTLKNP